MKGLKRNNIWGKATFNLTGLHTKLNQTFTEVLPCLRRNRNRFCSYADLNFFIHQLDFFLFPGKMRIYLKIDFTKLEKLQF